MSRATMPLNLRKKNHFLDKEGKPIPGVCCVCGCEEDNPCEEGCWWVNADQTMCSTCDEMIWANGAVKRIRNRRSKR